MYGRTPLPYQDDHESLYLHGKESPLRLIAALRLAKH